MPSMSPLTMITSGETAYEWNIVRSRAMWEWLQQQIDRLRGEVDGLKDEIGETDKELLRLADDLAKAQGEVTRNSKVQGHQGLELEAMKSRMDALEAEVARLKSRSHGKSIAAGRAKAKAQRLQEKLDRLKDN